MRRTNFLRALCLLPLSIAAAAAAAAPDAPDAPVTVEDAWVRATVPQQTATGAFMRLTASQPVRLVEVRSPVAAQADLHEMKLEGDVMRMRAVPALDLAEGRTVALKPGGYHIMLTGLKAPVRAGDTVPITLVTEGSDHRRRTVEVAATVRPLGDAGGASHPAGAGRAGH